MLIVIFIENIIYYFLIIKLKHRYTRIIII